MPRNLNSQATAQADRFRERLDDARAELVAAQQELSRRGDATFSMSDWPQVLGAEQHLEAATSALELRRAAEQLTRASVTTATPEELDQIEEDLRDNLVAVEDAIVMVRTATERLSRSRSARDRAALAVSRASDHLTHSSAWETEADKLQTRHDELRAALAAGPASTIATDAADLLGSSTMSDAGDRLRALLPATLFDRAEARATEARAQLQRAEIAAAAAEEVLESVHSSRSGIDGGSRVARRRMVHAETALTRYVRRASAGLTRAHERLDAISRLADLSSRQSAILLDETSDNQDARDAVDLESALAAALETYAERQADVDAAIIAALAEDPDRDPLTEGAVQAAVDARDDAAVQDPLSGARNDYDDDARRALSQWEVEVPPTIWMAARDYFAIVGELTELSDTTRRDDLVAAFDSAVDALADALDAEAVAARAEDTIAAHTSSLLDEVATLRPTAEARFFDYVRGAGLGGRTPLEV